MTVQILATLCREFEKDLVMFLASIRILDYGISATIYIKRPDIWVPRGKYWLKFNNAFVPCSIKGTTYRSQSKHRDDLLYPFVAINLDRPGNKSYFRGNLGK